MKPVQIQKEGNSTSWWGMVSSHFRTCGMRHTAVAIFGKSSQPHMACCITQFWRSKLSIACRYFLCNKFQFLLRQTNAHSGLVQRIFGFRKTKEKNTLSIVKHSHKCTYDSDKLTRFLSQDLMELLGFLQAYLRKKGKANSYIFGFL